MKGMTVRICFIKITETVPSVVLCFLFHTTKKYTGLRLRFQLTTIIFNRGTLIDTILVITTLRNSSNANINQIKAKRVSLN